MPVFFVLFVVVPITELWLFIQVGGKIGAFSTIALVILTAAVGSFLLKTQGRATLLRAQERAQQGELPLKELGDGFFLAVGGILLLTPGFLTDALGCFCLIPGLQAPVMFFFVRKLMPKFQARMNSSRFNAQAQRGSQHEESSGATFEGEYKREGQRDGSSNDKRIG